MESEVMKIVSFGEFMSRTLGGRLPAIDLSIYEGDEFECSCGTSHLFQRHQAIRELKGMRLVLECPQEAGFLTCVHIKGLLWFRGFKSEFGTHEGENS
jgi:hypothetical protein